MAGIYVHIPFCKQACNYCDFHFSTSLKFKDAFLAALKKEVVLQQNYLKASDLIHDTSIQTIYFGGGTPSLLSEQELLEFFEVLSKYFNIAPAAEITLEANPDDLDKNYLSLLRNTPINRLSIGIQSFCDEDLRFMNRAHTAGDAIRSVKQAQDDGFNNISIDLIYGTPTLSNEYWIKNLETAFFLHVQHISSYCLTVEPRTALDHSIKKGFSKNIDEEQSVEQFKQLMQEMRKNNFVQYEISNFCREGFYSRHNSNYWLKSHYLGLGPSAHSYDGISRQWNVANNAMYIKKLENNQLPFEKEILSISQHYNEYLLTSLRTIWGSDLKHIRSVFGEKFVSSCLKEAEKYIQSGDLIQQGEKLLLSESGKMIADRIAGDLFVI